MQAIILAFHLSGLHACVESSLGLVSLDKTRRRHSHILHNKPIGRAIVQMYIWNLYHFDVVKSANQDSWSIQHNMNHQNIEEYTSMP